ncbi:MAG: Endonuclease [Firmicutes bacterium]|nr:Endonuclease [Bacillota bacterium]MDI6704654.1 YraN family protein [Bacillota bacterium]
MASKKEIGDIGERAARSYIEGIGYNILDVNYRSKYGEIDIVAYDGTTLAFIEVKSRRSTRYGTPGEAVDWNKQKRMIKTAMAYLSQNRTFYSQLRFDVVEVIIKEKEIKQVRLIKDAFQSVGRF